MAASAPSSVGYAALERHFPISQSIPQYILVQSPRDLRSPQALADLEQMASRIAQLPDVSLVSGITRPLGEVPPEFRATFQAGIVGDRLAAGSAQIGERTGDLNQLTAGADTLADSLGDLRAQVNTIAPSIQSLIDAFSSVRTQYGGDKLVRDVETAAKLVDSINKLGTAMGVNFAAVKDMFAWIGPVLAALQGNAICDANPSCSATRVQFERLVAARNDGSVDEINKLAGQLQGVEDRQTLTATVNQAERRTRQVHQGAVCHGSGQTRRPAGGPDRSAARRQPAGRRKPAGGRRS